MIMIEGEIVEVGIGDMRDGVSIQIDDKGTDRNRVIEMTGFFRDELRTLGTMLFQRVTFRIESREDRERFNEEKPATPPPSNHDEATGIRKTGEI